MSTTSTVVELKCVSKKQSLHYDGKNIQHEIELEVPYDANSIFYKLSGGTNIILKTINQAAADMYVIGETYVQTHTPKPAATVEPVQQADGGVIEDESEPETAQAPTV